jgi:N4-(beta-N-acetylglucosaminyl)-L-asparaginase
MTISRRDFVRVAAGLTAAGLGGATSGMAQSEEKKQTAPAARSNPILISSANGVRACNRAFELIQQGTHPLDAVVAGINIVEDDPKDHSVGYGGLPNEDGVVELDSCVMDGPTHKCGAVGALRNIRNPSAVAAVVMRRTDHVLIVGEGALRFAVAHGFKEENLLTDEAREIWLRWKETHSEDDDWIRPEADIEADRMKKEGSARGKIAGPEFTWGTITCMALTPGGDLAGCTSTSGLSYKIAGRVGDSPIIGAGLYVDNEVGAAGSTGRGEANLQNCSSFMIVEFMRQGRTPEEACLEMLRRIGKNAEPRLRDKEGRVDFGLNFYALRKDGLFGGATFWGSSEMSVHDGTKCGKIRLPSLYGERPEAKG